MKSNEPGVIFWGYPNGSIDDHPIRDRGTLPSEFRTSKRYSVYGPYNTIIIGFQRFRNIKTGRNAIFRCDKRHADGYNRLKTRLPGLTRYTVQKRHLQALIRGVCYSNIETELYH